jgi:ketosteroid isomerase-like protein
MYQWIFKRQIVQGFQNISRAQFDEVLKVFDPHVHFRFVGDHAIAADVYSRELVKDWFERVHRLFPDLKVTPHHIRVTGWPWDITAVTQFDVEASLPDATPYFNQGVQILRIRRGRIVDDYLIEDTQLLVSALDQVAHSGNAEALAAPLV